MKSILSLLLISLCFNTLFSQNENQVYIEGGIYTPLYDSVPATVESFFIDIYAVTNEQYLQFVLENPQWQKNEVTRLFADELYLKHWQGNSTLGQNAPLNSPVTNVSWYAAKAYCSYHEKSLPTINQWEFVAMSGEKEIDARDKNEFNNFILEWYSRPTKSPLDSIGTTFKNYRGVYDMHGLIWEWTLDFNSVLISGESRKDNSVDRNLFCSAGAIGATDLKNYAAFLRYAYRGSLKANFNTNNLGFRCVSKIDE